MSNPSEEVIEQVRAMRACLLSTGFGRPNAARATQLLHFAKEQGREPTGEVLQTMAQLSVLAEIKIIEGLNNG